VYLQREIHIFFFESSQDGREAFAEIVEAFLPVFLVGGREGIDAVPDAAAGEAVDHRGETRNRAQRLGSTELAEVCRGSCIEEQPSCFSGVDHALGGSLADAFGIAIAPHFRGKD